MVFTALLPVLAVVSTLTNPEWSDEGEGGRPEGPVPLRRFFVRLLVAVAVFSVVVGVSRGFSVPHSSISSLNADGALIIFSTAVVAGVLFVVVGLLRRQSDVSRLYYPIIIAVAGRHSRDTPPGRNGFRQPVHYGGLQLLRAGDLVSAGLCGLLVAAFPDIGVRLGPRGLGFGDDLRLAGGFGNRAQPGRRQLVLGGYLGGHGLRAFGSLHAGAERPPGSATRCVRKSARRVGRPEWRLRACQHWGRLPRGCLQKEWAPSDVGRLTIAATRRMAAKATEMMR